MKKALNPNLFPLLFIRARQSLFTLFILVILTMYTSSCGNAESKDKAEEAISASEPIQEPTEVSISKEQFDALKIEMGVIEQKNLEHVLKSTGFLRVPPQSKANITSAIGGIVQSILVQEGNHVNKGQTVLTLINPEFIKMQEEFLETKSQLVYAEAEFNRQKELSSNNIASLKTFQQVEANFNSLRIKLSSLRQQLALLRINTSNLTEENIVSVINIVSPISGSVSEIDVNIGANAESSKTLMDIVDNSHLHLDLFVFEQELPKIKQGQTIDFNLTNLPGNLYSAKIYSIGSAFENETKTIPLHAEITGNKEGLIEGMNVTASINIDNNHSPAVPSGAISSFSGNDYIFIAYDLHVVGKTATDGKEGMQDGKDEKTVEKLQNTDIFSFKRVQIKKGITNGGYTEIAPLEEIPADTKVVINGSFYLMAMLTNAGEEE